MNIEDVSDFTTIQVDLIQMNDYLADSCAISPMAFLFVYIVIEYIQKSVTEYFIHVH